MIEKRTLTLCRALIETAISESNSLTVPAAGAGRRIGIRRFDRSAFLDASLAHREQIGIIEPGDYDQYDNLRTGLKGLTLPEEVTA